MRPIATNPVHPAITSVAHLGSYSETESVCEAVEAQPGVYAYSLLGPRDLCCRSDSAAGSIRTALTAIGCCQITVATRYDSAASRLFGRSLSFLTSIGQGALGAVTDCAAARF
jgi:hypothetical protein